MILIKFVFYLQIRNLQSYQKFGYSCEKINIVKISLLKKIMLEVFESKLRVGVFVKHFRIKKYFWGNFRKNALHTRKVSGNDAKMKI